MRKPYSFKDAGVHVILSLVFSVGFLAIVAPSRAASPREFCGKTGDRCQEIIENFAELPSIVERATFRHAKIAGERPGSYHFGKCAQDATVIMNVGKNVATGHLLVVTLLLVVQRNAGNQALESTIGTLQSAVLEIRKEAERLNSSTMKTTIQAHVNAMDRLPEALLGFIVLTSSPHEAEERLNSVATLFKADISSQLSEANRNILALCKSL